jgi:hypothetical protein
VHWSEPHEWAARVAPYNRRLLEALLPSGRRGSDAPTLYLEDGRPVVASGT